MVKDIIIICALTLDILYIIHKVLNSIGKLKEKPPSGVKCDRLKNEKCSNLIWHRMKYAKTDICPREDCPGFVYEADGEKHYYLSVYRICFIFVDEAPAIVALLLLILECYSS